MPDKGLCGGDASAVCAEPPPAPRGLIGLGLRFALAVAGRVGRGDGGIAAWRGADAIYVCMYVCMYVYMYIVMYKCIYIVYTCMYIYGIYIYI